MKICGIAAAVILAAGSVGTAAQACSASHQVQASKLITLAQATPNANPNSGKASPESAPYPNGMRRPGTNQTNDSNSGSSGTSGSGAAGDAGAGAGGAGAGAGAGGAGAGGAGGAGGGAGGGGGSGQ